jgi:hypothetical protein
MCSMVLLDNLRSNREVQSRLRQKYHDGVPWCAR